MSADTRQAPAHREVLLSLLRGAMGRGGATDRSVESHLRNLGLTPWSKAYVSRLLAGDAEASVDHVAAILDHVSVQAVAEAAAWCAGGTFVAAEAKGDLHKAIFGMAARHADLAHQIAAALEDGAVDERERALLLAATDRLITSAGELRAQLSGDGR